MLVINALVYFGFIGAWYFLLLTIMSSSVLAALSWILIEQPALALKHNPLRKIVSEDYTDQNEEASAISR
jgi:peptidoglycan/LPS O-acetylase OafA/YrhL